MPRMSTIGMDLNLVLNNYFQFWTTATHQKKKKKEFLLLASEMSSQINLFGSGKDKVQRTSLPLQSKSSNKPEEMERKTRLDLKQNQMNISANACF